MPQGDLDTLVSSVCAGGGNDRKIACETQAGDDPSENDVIADVEPDFPPESFWLSKDAEYDWFDRNAVYERKESTKGNSNPNPNPNISSNSQRSSVNNLKSRASIIGLPKTQKTTFVDSTRRTCNKPASVRLFPKRSGSVGKPAAVPAAEPGSPKVSCMGRVRSKRCRRRSNSLKRREKTAEKLRSGGGGDEKQRTGFYSKVMSIFRTKKSHRNPSGRSGSTKVEEESPAMAEPQRTSVSCKGREVPVGGETAAAEPPGLGGVKRFVSGRRSGSWGGDDFNQVISGEADSDRRVEPMSRR